MKRLYLLRHAEAENQTSGADRDRSLARRGYHEAESLGRLMRQSGYLPDFALCSGARRTRETCQILREFLPRHGVSYSEALYNAPSDTLFDAVRAMDERHSAVLLVAHNPGIYLLARSLENGENKALSSRLREGYPPGTLAVLDCPVESWSDIVSGRNIMRTLIAPADHPAAVSSVEMSSALSSA
ncbi:MAG: histidine phosphatase family protein [Rhodospirillales bacterium]|nr:histidine phosphatase family protein [Rhodospirillales bacterium]